MAPHSALMLTVVVNFNDGRKLARGAWAAMPVHFVSAGITSEMQGRVLL
jgi:hypothetical protein